jgi:hypothetical protein
LGEVIKSGPQSNQFPKVACPRFLPRFLHRIDAALKPPLFLKLKRAIAALGTERLRQTYQTTFWFDLKQPTCLPEEVIQELAPLLNTTRIVGVEWWLSRMMTTDVRVDFHRDRDEKRALRTGREIHPRTSSVLFLNRVRGGALAVTDQPPNPDNPSLAPDEPDFELIAPRPNRFVYFDGTLTHGVLDANNQIPDRRLPGRTRQRRTLVMNWWHQRPEGIPTFLEANVYRALRCQTR